MKLQWTKHIKKVFYLELLINLASIVQILFANQEFVRSFGVNETVPGLGESFMWFATLLVVMTYIMARALFSNNETVLRFTLEGYLIGDIIYLVVLVAFINAVGGVWTSTAIFGAGITLILLIPARIIYLWGPKQAPLISSAT